ncbi:SHOCT domain-containing protein [Rathayibacter soli]|uniref:SHOCT domain-containing protein n=1 Tax=Rathayibacter soli TaxID=3144168 RepID=UPI0027E55237|nr:SHOCT domain-containing protein [Glaciibacter superstes]
MLRRMGRPGLIGTMARTAVIAGTATAVSGGIRDKQQAGAQQHAAAAEQAAAAQQAEIQAQVQLATDQAQQAAAQAAAAAAAPIQDDMLTQLAKLGQMHQAGLINDAEFTAAKAKLLGI